MSKCVDSNGLLRYPKRVVSVSGYTDFYLKAFKIEISIRFFRIYKGKSPHILPL